MRGSTLPETLEPFYLNTLNSLIPGTPFETMALEEIITVAPEGEIFNNAAQVWNHTFYGLALARRCNG